MPLEFYSVLVATNSDMADCIGVFILINGINFINVKFFGELEFWFSLVKIIAIISMIGFGAYLLFSGSAGSQAGVQNLATRWFYAEWMVGLDYGDGIYNVCIWWA